MKNHLSINMQIAGKPVKEKKGNDIRILLEYAADQAMSFDKHLANIKKLATMSFVIKDLRDNKLIMKVCCEVYPTNAVHEHMAILAVEKKKYKNEYETNPVHAVGASPFPRINEIDLMLHKKLITDFVAYVKAQPSEPTNAELPGLIESFLAERSKFPHIAPSSIPAHKSNLNKVSKAVRKMKPH